MDLRQRQLTRQQHQLAPFLERDIRRPRDQPVAVAGPQAPHLGPPAVGGGVLLQFGIEEQQRERPLVDDLTVRRAVHRIDDAVVGVEHGNGERRETGRTLHLLQPFGDERREELAPQPLGVDAQRDEAGHPVARRKDEAQLRMEVGAPSLDR